MATFDDSTVGTSTGGTTPDFGAKRMSKPKVKTVSFGDGYQQRLVFGLNQSPKTWDLTWTAKDSTDADAIEAFLEARAGQELFDWVPPDDTSSYKWICESWRREHRYANVNTIKANFKQVFEP